VNQRQFVPLVLSLILIVSPAIAITDEEIFRDLRFNFINPGGRSLAMGGAFISLADDATAAQANPAGLTTLLSPQLFLETRAATPDNSTTSRMFRDPLIMTDGFNVGVQTVPDSSFSPSFLSYVWPRNRFSLGFSRQEVINISNTTSNSFEFLFGNESDFRNGAGNIDLSLVNLNVSVAVKAHENVRLGLTASYGTLDLKSSLVNTYIDPSGNLIGDTNLAGVPLEMYRTEADDSDSDVTLTFGLLWRIVEKVSFGAVYRQGGDFAVPETMIATTIDQSLVPGMITQTAFFNESDTFVTPQNKSFSFPNEFHIPDVLGAGISYKPVPHVTFSLDVVNIGYSDLMQGFNSRLNVLTVGFATEADAAFTLDDQTNIHFGSEAVFALPNKRAAVILRTGTHQDKDSRLRSDFAPGGFGLGENKNFPGRKDEIRYSLGIGLVFGNNLQIDTAADFSELGTEGVVSLIYKF